MARAEKHELVEALAFDGTDEALGVIVQVGTAWRQADRGDAAAITAPWWDMLDWLSFDGRGLDDADLAAVEFDDERFAGSE